MDLYNKINLFENSYLAAANPDSYPDEFWEMLLASGSSLIIKLNAESATYWKKEYLEVVNEGFLTPFLTERIMKITLAGQTTEVTHLEFTNWPDYGAPIKDEFDVLLNRIHQIHPIKTPLTIHCQGGIGRTGTLIALHTLQAQPEIKPSTVIEMIRAQRCPHMVESIKQLKFIDEYCFQW